jgi:hypothetical protein
MDARFCDDRGEHGFSWTLAEPATRTSHALAADGRTWLVDPVDWPEAIERALGLGRPQAVLQLLDRHNRDCAAVAARLAVPHHVAPDIVPASPFEAVEVKRSKRWAETALWWPQERTLAVAEAVGTNAFYTGGRPGAGVHLLLRLSPPRRQLGAFEPEHLLVGHGEGLHGDAATTELRRALARSHRDLLRVAPRIPALIADARRRRR